MEEEKFICPKCKRKALTEEIIEYFDEFVEEDGSTWADFSYKWEYSCPECGFYQESDEPVDEYKT